MNGVISPKYSSGQPQRTRGIIHFVAIEGLRGKQPIGLVGDNLEKARTVM